MRPLEGPQAPFSGVTLPMPCLDHPKPSSSALVGGLSAPPGGPHAQRVAPRGGRQTPPLNLIHVDNCSNPATTRAAARFEAPEGLPLELLESRCPLSFLMGFRAGQASQPKPTL
jgi:hypothetical protein